MRVRSKKREREEAIYRARVKVILAEKRALHEPCPVVLALRRKDSPGDAMPPYRRT
jgi:septum formation topological specificity factor MinE